MICSGVRRDTAPIPASEDDWVADLGTLTLRMPAGVPRQHFDYVVELLGDVLPPMIEVLGESGSPPVLRVDTRSQRGNFYGCVRNEIFMVSPDAAPNAWWNNIFVHELAHSFQGDLLCTPSIYPQWIEEGMAEAARYFVRQATEHRSGRDFLAPTAFGRSLSTNMSVFDLLDRAGGQVWGGRNTFPFRELDAELYYLMAGISVVLPAMAEIAAGHDVPHPMARLSTALRQELQASPYWMYGAMDRAWTAAVDGVAPPSRWLRKRCISEYELREGSFLAVAPAEVAPPVNPTLIRVIRIERPGGEVFGPSELRYHDVHGRARAVTTFNGTHPVPEDLAHGAYRVDATDLRVPESPQQAHTYFLKAPTQLVGERLASGLAVVFVDAAGALVDVPVSELAVSGRILASVPGGVIATTYSGKPGSLTFTWRGRHLGTLTATEPYPRVTTLRVDVDPAPDRGGVAWWEPYHPVRGQPLEVFFRLPGSSLDPRATAVDLILTGLDGTTVTRQSMLPFVPAQGILRSVLQLPPALAAGKLAFTDGERTHGSPCVTPCNRLWAYEFATAAEDVLQDAAFFFDGRTLWLDFPGPVQPEAVRLQRAAVDASWTDVAARAAQAAANRLRWDLSLEPDGGATYRLQQLDPPAPERTLWMQFLEITPRQGPVVALSPFPNPSPEGAFWPISVTSPTRIVFEVFDVRGRRLHEHRLLAHPGITMLHWSGSRGNVAAAQGTYFLRFSGGGADAVRKLVLLR